MFYYYLRNFVESPEEFLTTLHNCNHHRATYVRLAAVASVVRSVTPHFLYALQKKKTFRNRKNDSSGNYFSVTEHRNIFCCAYRQIWELIIVLQCVVEMIFVSNKNNKVLLMPKNKFKQFIKFTLNKFMYLFRHE